MKNVPHPESHWIKPLNVFIRGRIWYFSKDFTMMQLAGIVIDKRI